MYSIIMESTDFIDDFDDFDDNMSDYNSDDY